MFGRSSIRVEGLPELRRQIERVGKIPKKVITKSAREGINPVLKDARKAAPKRKGFLKKGIVKRLEKTKSPDRKFKSVYQIVFDRKLNHIFQKESVGLHRKVRGRGRNKTVTWEKKKYYYPVSQEYGFKLRNGGKKAGKFFIKNAFAGKQQNIQQRVANTLGSEIDKLSQ